LNIHPSLKIKTLRFGLSKDLYKGETAMEKKDYLVRIFFVLFVVGYLLAATAECIWTNETKQQTATEQTVSKKKNVKSENKELR
jgi:hypothetical protein